MRNLFFGTLLLLSASVMGLEGVQQRRSVLRLRSVVDSSRKLQTAPPQDQPAESIPEVPEDGEMPAGEQATEQSEEAPEENEAPEVTPNPPDETPPETPPVAETSTEAPERSPPDVPEPCSEENPDCDTQSSNTEQSAPETHPVDEVPSEGSAAAPPDEEEPSGEDHPEIRTQAPRTQAPRTQAPGNQQPQMQTQAPGKQQPKKDYYNYNYNPYYRGGPPAGAQQPGQNNYGGQQGDGEYDDQYYEGDDEKDFDEEYDDDQYMDDEEQENDDEIEKEWGEGESSTASTGKAPKWTKGEDENFFKATEHKIEDVAHNQNALIAISVIAAVVLSLTLCAICQSARNPDGCCARCCSSMWNCVCTLCWPCRTLCGLLPSKSRNRQQRELEMNTDDTYEYDNSVELT